MTLFENYYFLHQTNMKKIALLSVVLVLMFLTHNNALACVCSMGATNDKELKQAVIEEFNYVPLVFSGKVIAAEYIPVIKKDYLGKQVNAENLVYRLSVDKVYKGEAVSEVILVTDVFRYGTISETTSCDFNYRGGEQYLVYATLDLNGKFRRNGCGRTDLIKNAKKDIKVLQKLTSKMKH
jgi:hypothetical protein